MSEPKQQKVRTYLAAVPQSMVQDSLLKRRKHDLPGKSFELLTGSHVSFDLSTVSAFSGLNMRNSSLLHAAPYTQSDTFFSSDESTETILSPEIKDAQASFSFSLLVEDTVSFLNPGQMHRSEFLQRLREEITRIVDTALTGTGRNTDGCPYIRHWFNVYSRRDSYQIERALHRYAPESRAAKSALEYISIAVRRAGTAAEKWAVSGQITGLPPGITSSLTGEPSLEPGSLASQPDQGGTFHELQQQLGEGQPLDSRVRSRMESVFGMDFSGVRAHTGADAASQSRRLNARAFTLGNHIAFNDGEYSPGTPVGDALIAHELAHTIQQRVTGQDIPETIMEHQSTGYDALEADADRTATEVLVSLWKTDSGLSKPTRQQVIPSLKTGLALQRCATTRSQTQTQPTTGRSRPPVLRSPSWSVAPAPILIPNGYCHLRLAHSNVRSGMRFDGQIHITPGCSGRVYFVQYVKPNFKFVTCYQNRAGGLCVSHNGGIDGSWPYQHASNIDTHIPSGTQTNAIYTEDSPGQENLSRPGVNLVRLCLDHEFVTYIVFEDTIHNLTPLGWMEWTFDARAWRNSGNCPVQSSSQNCSGWNVSGNGRKVRENFTPGIMHGSVKLSRNAPVINMATLLTSAVDCQAATCPTGTAAPSSTQKSSPGTHNSQGQNKGKEQ